MTIPKIIHYCWFGKKPLPESALRCIDSWKKYCPDYEIIEWNENNFDINNNLYCKQAYESKKYAFVADVARLYALYQYGGIYLDTDMELLKPIDFLLDHLAFTGTEDGKNISAGILGCQKNTRIFHEFLSFYEKNTFIKEDGSFELNTICHILTGISKKYGFIEENNFQTIEGLVVYPVDYFYPKNFLTGKLKLTSNSVSIHHFDATWWDEDQRKRFHKQQKIRKFLGEKFGNKTVELFNLIDIFMGSIQKKGLFVTLKKSFKLLFKKFKR